MSLLQRYYDLKTVQKVGLLIAAASLGTLTTGIIGFSVITNLQNSLSSMYTNNTISISNLNLARTKGNGIKSDLFEICLTQDKERQQKLIKDIEKRNIDVDKIIADYEKSELVSFEKEKIAELKPILIDYEKIQNNIIDYAKNGEIQTAYKYLSNNSGKIEKTQQIFRDLAEFNNKEAREIHKTSNGNASRQKIFIIFSIVLPIIFSIWFGCFISFRIQELLDRLVAKMDEVAKGNLKVDGFGYISKSDVGQLCSSFDIMLKNLKNLITNVAGSAEDISASSEEMSSSSEQTAQGAQQTANSTTQLAQGAQEISRNVEQGASNISKMNKAIQGVSEEAKVVAQLGNDTETNANTGAEHVKKAVNKIDSIKKVSEDISVNISELGKLSSEIEQIVDLIKNIAGQTNLLALNAAIEAARAGEHGKGFAVVADEVKKLAGQSAGATEKITAMIKEIQNKTQVAVTTMDKATNEVEEGVFVINDAGKALENIITQVKAANVKIQGITKEIDGVAKNSEDMVQMIENISAITEETAASAEEISSITEEQTASMEEISASSQTLAGIAEKLTKQVSIFKF